MDGNKCFKTGLWGSIIAAICCFTPVLVIGLGLIGLAALTPYLDHVLFPVLGIFLILALYGWSKRKSVVGGSGVGNFLRNPDRRLTMEKEITVYSATGGSSCNSVKEFLSHHKIPFTDRNVAEDTDALRELTEKTGRRATPVIVIDGEVVVGFDRGKLDRLLGL